MLANSLAVTNSVIFSTLLSAIPCLPIPAYGWKPCHVFLTILGTFVLSFGSEACQSFLYLLCYIFLANLLLDDRLLEAVLIAVAVIIGIVSTRLVSTLRAGPLTLLGTCVSTVVATTLEVGSIVDVHFLLIDTDTFLLAVGIAGSGILQLAVITADFLDDSFLHLLLLILANLFLLFTLLAFLLFRFLLRACGLVQSRQVYLSDDINLRNKLRLMYLEDFFSFFFPLFSTGASSATGTGAGASIISSF